jgi:DNA repair protein RadC
MGRESVGNRPVITSASQLQAYVKLALAHETREQFRVLFLNKKNQLIQDEVMHHGAIDHAPAYPREVMRRALEVGAGA